MEIKLLNTNDILYYQDKILKLLDECIINTYTKPATNSYLKEKLYSLIENTTKKKAYIFAAIQEQQLFGFLWSYVVTTPFEPHFHIAYLAVMPEKHNRGIGRLLLAAAEKQAIELGIFEVELIVSNYNLSAAEFYKKHNYRTDRLIMNKILKTM